MSADADRRWLRGALLLIVAFMAGEVVVGVMAQSLALISDAAHMFTDAASIALALWAIRLAARPASGRMTFGWKRAEILSAQVNGATLLLLGGWLGYEAIERLVDPPEVAGGLVFVTALVGIVVNVAAAWMISKANRSSLNVEGAFQHILNDLFAFIATAVSGLVMVLTGFTRADGIASLIVVVLMVKAGIGLLRDSGRILLEAAPAELDPSAVGQAMTARPHVAEVHDLHIWQITSGQPALSAHVLVAAGQDCHAVRSDLKRLLANDFHLEHVTLQVDHDAPDAGQPAVEPTRTHCAQAHGPVFRCDPESLAKADGDDAVCAPHSTGY
ncbi:cation diffusion facilitator family transporter [Streptoalloteichus hindustanus]|uniref:cation diffusion facilitator family transporter n=1 Tax=Streptoalloteichus hindustanus TaxID=2017 RepID=UPI001F35752E|nr:cation diffusion facilitator family transporter [Streptoalloteichus hindustanus]